jgi:hypothetical protein
MLSRRVIDNYIHSGVLLTVVNYTLREVNGTAHFTNVNNCLNTNIYSYLDTSGGKSYKLYLNVVHFFNTSVN